MQLCFDAEIFYILYKPSMATLNITNEMSLYQIAGTRENSSLDSIVSFTNARSHSFLFKFCNGLCKYHVTDVYNSNDAPVCMELN